MGQRIVPEVIYPRFGEDGEEIVSDDGDGLGIGEEAHPIKRKKRQRRHDNHGDWDDNADTTNDE